MVGRRLKRGDRMREKWRREERENKVERVKRRDEK